MIYNYIVKSNWIIKLCVNNQTNQNYSRQNVPSINLFTLRWFLKLFSLFRYLRADKNVFKTTIRDLNDCCNFNSPPLPSSSPSPFALDTFHCQWEKTENATTISRQNGAEKREIKSIDPRSDIFPCEPIIQCRI